MLGCAKGTDTCVEYQLETVMEIEKCIAWTRDVRLQYLFEVHVYRGRNVAGSFVEISRVRSAVQENTIQKRGKIWKGKFIVGQNIKYKNFVILSDEVSFTLSSNLNNQNNRHCYFKKALTRYGVGFVIFVLECDVR